MFFFSSAVRCLFWSGSLCTCTNFYFSKFFFLCASLSMFFSRWHASKQTKQLNIHLPHEPKNKRTNKNADHLQRLIVFVVWCFELYNFIFISLLLSIDWFFSFLSLRFFFGCVAWFQVFYWYIVHRNKDVFVFFLSLNVQVWINWRCTDTWRQQLVNRTKKNIQKIENSKVIAMYLCNER